jgi:hypothetical protein
MYAKENSANVWVDDQLPGTHSFNVGVNWYHPIIEYLKKIYFDNNVPKEERSRIIIRAKPYIIRWTTI